MREYEFLYRNEAKWKDLERQLEGQQEVDPDQKARAFVQVTDDLSFARTYYPESRITDYLNNMAARVHQRIYVSRAERKQRLFDFWKWEVPELFYKNRRFVGYALFFFLASVAVAALSTHYDENYPRLILGDDYVNMTIQNIERGDPAGVYKGGSMFGMFFRIMVNNILVGLRTLAAGMFFSIGTVFLLFINGSMVGTFFAFFFQYNVASQAMPVIMLHGTIELSTIVLDGAAGLVLGNSLLFPGSYSRAKSLKRGAKEGLKMALGVVPFTVAAAFIEGFLTRFSSMPAFMMYSIIGLSAAVVIYYFGVYPFQVHKTQHHAQAATARH